MSTYNHVIQIGWGPGTAPDGIRIVAADGVHTPTIVSAIAETATGSGTYMATVTIDQAWGAWVDWWFITGGQWWRGDGAISLVTVNGVTASVDTTLAQDVSDLKKVAQAQEE